MKKIFRNLVLLTLTVSMLFMLTACGNKEEEDIQSVNPGQSDVNSNKKVEGTPTGKLVATKTVIEEGVEIKETIEVTLKDGKAEKVETTYEFEDEETAEMFAKELEALVETTEFMEALINKLEQNGNKITITMLAEELEMETMTIEEVKKMYEAEGYRVQII